MKLGKQKNLFEDGFEEIPVPMFKQVSSVGVFKRSDGSEYVSVVVRDRPFQVDEQVGYLDIDR